MKILVVDDEKNVRRILGDYLRNEGYEVVEAVDGEDGIDRLIEHKDVDLVLLDIRMPNMDGYEAIGHMKEVSDAPIIFLTALNESFDEVKGLDLGADDYIAKPFSYNVLTARVKSCLRKNKRFDRDILEIDKLKVDYTNKQAFVEEVDCHLTVKEFELLNYMIKNKHMSLDRQKILDRIWGYDYEGDPRTVDTHMKTLRAKLGPYGAFLRTVRGVGYKFEEN